MREGKRPQKERVDGAENRGVRADADREGEHGDGGEGRCAAKGAEREARVLQHAIEERESGHGARRLGDGCEVAEAAARGEARLACGERAARRVLALHGLEGEMEVHFLVELARVLSRARERAQLVAETVDERQACLRPSS